MGAKNWKLKCLDFDQFKKEYGFEYKEKKRNEDDDINLDVSFMTWLVLFQNSKYFLFNKNVN